MIILAIFVPSKPYYIVMKALICSILLFFCCSYLMAQRVILYDNSSLLTRASEVSYKYSYVSFRLYSLRKAGEIIMYRSGAHPEINPIFSIKHYSTGRGVYKQGGVERKVALQLHFCSKVRILDSISVRFIEPCQGDDNFTIITGASRLKGRSR